MRRPSSPRRCSTTSRSRRWGSLTDKCFTLAGAEGAEPVLARYPRWPASTPERRARGDHAAHQPGGPPRARAPVQHLTHDGVILDVLGVRALGARPRRRPARRRKTTPGSVSPSPPSPFCVDPRTQGPRLPRRCALPRRLRAGAEDEPLARRRLLKGPISRSPKLVGGFLTPSRAGRLPSTSSDIQSIEQRRTS